MISGATDPARPGRSTSTRGPSSIPFLTSGEHGHLQATLLCWNGLAVLHTDICLGRLPQPLRALLRRLCNPCLRLRQHLRLDGGRRLRALD